MFQHLKRLGTETAVYGISTIVGRFLNFLLVPFYTNVLQPGDYGIVAYVYSIIAFITVVYSYGMESAYFKYSSTLEIGRKEENFSTPFLSLLGTSVSFSLVILAVAHPIADAISLPPAYSSAVLYAAGILALDAVAIIPFASLRMEHRAKMFASIKFLNIVINVGMNILLLVGFRMGVMGVFVSGLVASGVTVLMLLPTLLQHFSAGFNPRLWKALVAFGIPSIPSGLTAMAIQVIDRPILRALTDDATVGIYQANYRLGIFMMLIVSMYDYAWRPFYFSMAREPNAKEIFARVLTYLVLFMSGVFLMLTFFIGDIAGLSFFGRHLIHPKYWSGLEIVPVVLMGYLFLGVSTNLSAGIYIEKKTRYLPIMTSVGAVVNICANYILIPRAGMLGAAWATLLAYFFMAVTTYIFVQRIYPTRYEYTRIAKVALCLGVVLALYYWIPAELLGLSGVLFLLWRIVLLLLFVVMVYAMKIFEPAEIAALNFFFKRRKEPPAGFNDDSKMSDTNTSL